MKMKKSIRSLKTFANHLEEEEAGWQERDVTPAQTAVVLCRGKRSYRRPTHAMGISGIPWEGVHHQCQSGKRSGKENVSGQCAAQKMCDRGKGILRMV